MVGASATCDWKRRGWAARGEGASRRRVPALPERLRKATALFPQAPILLSALKNASFGAEPVPQVFHITVRPLPLPPRPLVCAPCHVVLFRADELPSVRVHNCLRSHHNAVPDHRAADAHGPVLRCPKRPIRAFQAPRNTTPMHRPNGPSMTRLQDASFPPGYTDR